MEQIDINETNNGAIVKDNCLEKDTMTLVRNNTLNILDKEVFVLFEKLSTHLEYKKSEKMLEISKELITSNDNYNELIKKYMIAEKENLSNELYSKGYEIKNILIKILSLYNAGEYKQIGKHIENIHKYLRPLKNIPFSFYELLDLFEEKINKK